MIAGGFRYEDSAYILNIQFDVDNPAKIVNVSHSSLPRIPFEYYLGFYESCQGRLIIGSGDRSLQIYELDGIDFMDDLPSTKIQRVDAAAVYHSGNKTLIMSGGYDKNAGEVVDSIEMLKIDTNSNGMEWKLHHCTLPHPLYYHTMTLLRNEIVLIGGGKSYSDKTNEAWKGIIQGNGIRFDQLPSMKNKRSGHFAFAIKGIIYVFGGEENEDKNSKIEKYDPIIKQWTDGPLMDYGPCYLSKWFGDNAVINRQGKIILLKKGKGIGIYDPEKNSIDFFAGQFQMRENDRRGYAALLI